jgi:Ca2+-transporting ATPase
MPNPSPNPSGIPLEFRVDDAHVAVVGEVLARLGTTPDGLPDEEAARRRAILGDNELPVGRTRTVLEMVRDQFRDFLILLLLGAAVISGLLGDAADTVAILVIVLLNAVIGVVQEYRAERAMEALRGMAAETAAVRRGGGVLEVPAAELTVGDIVLLDAGRIVPADLRILESAGLRIAEAALTGESLPVEKTVEPLIVAHAPIGDRSSMAYKGTHVVHGRGTGVVTGVGLASELGKIALLLGDTGDVKTPLQKRLAQFGKGLGFAALGLCSIVFVVGIIRGEDLLVMFLTSVSLAVAAVPEALPAVATIALALGASRLVRSHTLVRKLPAVETLGSVTYICTDKTGTLTVNRMTVERLVLGDSISDALASEADPSGGSAWFGRALALSNDVAGAEGALVGDPTEVAFYRAAAEHGYQREVLEPEYPRLAELPFDSDRKLMTTVHRLPAGGCVSFTKGAAEALLDRASGVLGPDGTTRPLDRAAADKLVDEWSSAGLRVLAFGMRRVDTTPIGAALEALESELTILGYAGLLDPPREEAATAVAECIGAGIIPVMITGDHPATALAIARRLGIAADAEQMISGPELAQMDLHHFEQRVQDIRVYARVAPEQKVAIVRALQDRGEYVAMTGDGVNDAPALARADIGVAMGITGTDVAKEAADMVLLDDNFSSIVSSVREGRRIFDNIRKFIKYTMTSNSGEIWTILLAPLLGMPVPLLPIHILWINLVTDGLPGLALAGEPHERNIMKRPPRAPEESIFADGLGVHLLWVGLLMGAASLFTQAWAMEHSDHGDLYWRTMVFTVLCLSQLGHALAVRSDRQSLFSLGLLSNKPLLGAVALTFALQMATIYVPLLQPVFKTSALSAGDLAIALAASTVVFWAVEIEKMVKRRREA